MTTISSTELARQLSDILQAIASGEEFLVTEEGRPLARLLPATPSSTDRALSGEAWQNAFDAWMKRVESRTDRYPPGFAVDDSFEAIYGERENAQR